jgi:hypothetical protein
MSIIAVKFENSKLNSLSKSVQSSTQLGGATLTGRDKVFAFMKYLFSEQYKNKPDSFNADSHVGNHLFRTNIKIDMPTPFEMNEMNAFKTEAEYKEYQTVFLNKVTNAFMNASDPKHYRKGGNQWDIGRYIIACTEKELSVFPTFEEKAAFIMDYAEKTIMALSNCKTVEEINFEYVIVPHMKDGNPDCHISFASYDFDLKPVDFYRTGKNNVLGKFNNVKFEMEKEFPNLDQMETIKRQNKIKETENTQSYDASIIKELTRLSKKYSGTNYYHADVKKDFEKAGFKTLFQKNPKKLLISLNDGKFKSFEDLNYELKRFVEQYDEMEYLSSKSDVDISLVVKQASEHINNHIAKGNPVDFETLNKQLKEQFGVCLSAKEVVRNDKTGAWDYKKWSLHFLGMEVKVSAQKYGIDVNNLLITRKQVLQMQEEIKSLEEERKEKIKLNGYEKWKKREKEPFMMQEGETHAEWVARTEKDGWKSSLHNAYLEGNKMFGKNHRELLTMLSHNKVQVNRGGELEAVLHYIATGHKSIEFIGPDNPAIQARIYKYSVQNGLAIKNYTPPEYIRAEAQQALDAVYHQILGKNTVMIDMKHKEFVDYAEMIKKNPELAQDKSLKPKAILLSTNYKWEREIDSRPKVYAYLYGIYNGLSPDAFQHADSILESTDKESLKKIIADFQQSFSITDSQMSEILKDAQIDPDADRKPEMKLVAPKQYDPQSGITTPSQPAPGSTSAPAFTQDDKETEQAPNHGKRSGGGVKAKPMKMVAPKTEAPYAGAQDAGQQAPAQPEGNEALSKFKRGAKNKM